MLWKSIPNAFDSLCVFQDQDRHRTSYKCLKCDTVIHHHRKFAQHIRITSDKQITCETVCPDARGLGGYQRTLFLKGYKNYLCHTCGASFTEKSTFYNHIEGHGEHVEKKYICEYCPYSSTRQRRLLNHTLSKHSTEPRPRPNVCEVCGKGFFNKNMLGRHKIDVHVKDKKFKCDLCPKVFLRRHKLATHMNLHSGIRPFVCNQCGQSFTVAYNLKVHERLHTGEKPYKCDQCDAAFAQKNSLDVHMKKHGVGSARQERACSNPRPRVNSFQPPRMGCPQPQPQPQPQPMGSVQPPLNVSAQHRLVDSTQPQRLGSPQHLGVGSPPQHGLDSPNPPGMDYPPHQRLDLQQPLDYHQPLRGESTSPPRPRVESYMYPGYSGVVFPGLPGATYPFYPNL